MQNVSKEISSTRTDGDLPEVKKIKLESVVKQEESLSALENVTFNNQPITSNVLEQLSDKIERAQPVTSKPKNIRVESITGAGQEVYFYKGIPFAPNKKIIYTETAHEIIIEEIWAEKTETEIHLHSEIVETIPFENTSVEEEDVVVGYEEKSEDRNLTEGQLQKEKQAIQRGDENQSAPAGISVPIPEYEQLYEEGGVPAQHSQSPERFQETFEYSFGTRQEAEDFAMEREKERLQKIAKEMAGEIVNDKDAFVRFLKESKYSLSKYVRIGLASLMLMFSAGSSLASVKEGNQKDQKKTEERLSNEDLSKLQASATVESEKRFKLIPNIDVNSNVKRVTVPRPPLKVETIKVNELPASVFHGESIKVKSERSPKFEVNKMSQEEIAEMADSVVDMVLDTIGTNNVLPEDAEIVITSTGLVSPEGDLNRNVQLAQGRAIGGKGAVEKQVLEQLAKFGIEKVRFELNDQSSSHLEEDINNRNMETMQMFGLKSQKDLTNFYKAYNRGNLDLTHFTQAQIDYLKNTMDDSRGVEFAVTLAGTSNVLDLETIEDEIPQTPLSVPVPSLDFVVTREPAPDQEEAKPVPIPVPIPVPPAPISEKREEPADVLPNFEVVADPQIHYERPAKNREVGKILKPIIKKVLVTKTEKGVREKIHPIDRTVIVPKVEIKRKIKRIKKSGEEKLDETARGTIIGQKTKSIRRETQSHKDLGKGARGKMEKIGKERSKRFYRGETGSVKLDEDGYSIEKDQTTKPDESLRVITGKFQKRKAKEKEWQAPRRRARKDVTERKQSQFEE